MTVARLTAAGRAAAWAAVGGAFAIAIWWAGSAAATGLPSPASGLSELWHLASRPFYNNGPNDKGIGLQLLMSLRRVFTGFTLAAIVGIPAGLALGLSKRAFMAGNPVVQMLRPVSPLAWFPIWLVVFKNAGQAAIWVIFITALWPIIINTAAGVGSVPRDQRNVARVFHFGRVAYLRHVVFPNTLPSIVTGLRLSMGVAWMVIVAVEMLSGGTGVGFFVWNAYNASDLSAVIATLLLIGLVGLALDFAFLRLSRFVALEEAMA